MAFSAIRFAGSGSSTVTESAPLCPICLERPRTAGLVRCEQCRARGADELEEGIRLLKDREAAAARETEEATRRHETEVAKVRREAEEEVRRREAEAERLKRRQALFGELSAIFVSDFLSAADVFASHPDAALIGDADYEAHKTAFVQEWAARLREPLDEEQAAAVVATDGNVLVAARAGSGKTRTLATRALFLLKHCGASPRELLLLAFHRDAADGMKQRLADALGDDATLPHVMTFHALAYALVHPNEDLAFDDRGADSLVDGNEIREVVTGFRDKAEGEVIRALTLSHFTPRDADTLVAKLIDDLGGLGAASLQPSAERLWARVRERAADSFSEATANFVGRCRKRNLTPDGLDRLIADHVPALLAEELFLRAASPVYRGYLERLEAEGKEDFDGLMWRAVERVRGGDTAFVRDRGRERGDLRSLRFVMIDEFQDFSRMFCDLTDAIREVNPGARFFGVGDDWQAINGFAGSGLEFFAHFDRYFGPGTRRLGVRTNYRSAPAVVEVGNALMRGLGDEARASRGDGGGVRVGDLAAFEPSAFEREQHDWDAITPAVLRLVRWFLSAGQEAVLLSRTNRVPWEVRWKPRHRQCDLGDFLDHVRAFLPEDDRRRVTASTTHSYKGCEQQAVVVLDALERRYPLIRPHRVFTRILGDSPARIEEEERRLLYVAMTRARDNLVLLTETGRQSPWLADVEGRRPLPRVRWDALPRALTGR